jgi:hypothetical protein
MWRDARQPTAVVRSLSNAPIWCRLLVQSLRELPASRRNLRGAPKGFRLQPAQTECGVRDVEVFLRRIPWWKGATASSPRQSEMCCCFVRVSLTTARSIYSRVRSWFPTVSRTKFPHLEGWYRAFSSRHRGQAFPDVHAGPSNSGDPDLLLSQSSVSALVVGHPSGMPPCPSPLERSSHTKSASRTLPKWERRQCGSKVRLMSAGSAHTSYVSIPRFYWIPHRGQP